MSSKDYLKYKNTMHFFHFLMCMLTGGIWLIVWICCAVLNSIHNTHVDDRAFQMLEADRLRNIK